VKEKDDIFALVDLIRETSFALHRYLRYGYLEKVYENGLAHRLRKVQLTVEQQYPLKVYDEDDTVLGEYFADLFVESKLIVIQTHCRIKSLQGVGSRTHCPTFGLFTRLPC